MEQMEPQFSVSVQLIGITIEPYCWSAVHKNSQVLLPTIQSGFL